MSMYTYVGPSWPHFRYLYLLYHYNIDSINYIYINMFNRYVVCNIIIYLYTMKLPNKFSWATKKCILNI